MSVAIRAVPSITQKGELKVGDFIESSSIGIVFDY